MDYCRYAIGNINDGWFGWNWSWTWGLSTLTFWSLSTLCSLISM